MTDPFFDGQAATHFIAGDDPAAKATVAELVGEFGWDVVDVGGMDQSFYLEALAMLWVNYAIRTGSWGQAFKLLRR
jgi:predicted dinucleotide-binding enzyme